MFVFYHAGYNRKHLRPSGELLHQRTQRSFFMQKNMKQKDNVTVYYCDFCPKKLLRAHAMVNHEKRCVNNPDNFTACTGCENIERKTIECDYGYEKTLDLQGFYCKAKNIFLYPPIVEHRDKIPEVVYFEGKEVVQERMPKTCSSFNPLF